MSFGIMVALGGMIWRFVSFLLRIGIELLVGGCFAFGVRRLAECGKKLGTGSLVVDAFMSCLASLFWYASMDVLFLRDDLFDRSVRSYSARTFSLFLLLFVCPVVLSCILEHFMYSRLDGIGGTKMALVKPCLSFFPAGVMTLFVMIVEDTSGRGKIVDFEKIFRHYGMSDVVHEFFGSFWIGIGAFLILGAAYLLSYVIVFAVFGRNVRNRARIGFCLGLLSFAFRALLCAIIGTTLFLCGSGDSFQVISTAGTVFTIVFFCVLIPAGVLIGHAVLDRVFKLGALQSWLLPLGCDIACCLSYFPLVLIVDMVAHMFR